MYLFFDTETTGLPQNYQAPLDDFLNWPRLVQIAWSFYDARGNHWESYSYIIKPLGFVIPPEATKIHRISQECAILEGVDLKKALTHFLEDVKKASHLIAHNIDFDEKIIGAEFLRKNIYNPIEEKQKICTMHSTVDFCAIKSKYGNKWPKLAELHYKLFDCDFEDAHDAETDIRITAKCFWELKKRKII